MPQARSFCTSLANGDWLFQGEAFTGIVRPITTAAFDIEPTPAFLQVSVHVNGLAVRFEARTQRDVEVLEIELDGRIGHGMTLHADRDQLAALRDTLTGHLEQT